MKTTIKLLLGATVVAGLSISAFAACATDVDFGGTKKITGLADGGATGEAVTYNQVFTETFVLLDKFDMNSTESAGEALRLVKSGGMVCLDGIVRNHGAFAGTIPIPAEYRRSSGGYTALSVASSVATNLSKSNVNYESNTILSLGLDAAGWTMLHGCWPSN